MDWILGISVFTTTGPICTQFHASKKYIAMCKVHFIYHLNIVLLVSAHISVDKHIFVVIAIVVFITAVLQIKIGAAKSPLQIQINY